MPHGLSLITTIAASFGLAFILGFVAVRLRLPAIVGYLVAGIVIGPATPGFVADAALSAQLAEIGVMLLMFGVGLHFSLEDLLLVRKIAITGALVRMAIVTAAGVALAAWWGWSLGAGLILGLALSVASTVVVLKALEKRGELDTLNGRIALGWLIVEDLAMVLVLVLLPAFAGAPAPGEEATGTFSGLGMAIVTTLAQVGAFMIIMLVGGRRFFPWILWHVAKTGSRELFTLCVVAAAVGVAYASSELFGVSFALGAFFAGMMLRESALSHRAAEESLPLRDAFSVLFFVSVGMLFDPSILVREPLRVLIVVAVIVLGKFLVAFPIVVSFRYSMASALTVSASLAQIGEFSFILGALGKSLGLMPATAAGAIVAAALITIALNSWLMGYVDPWERWLRSRPRLWDLLSHRSERRARALAPPPAVVPTEGRRAVIVGYGPAGQSAAAALEIRGVQSVILESNVDTVHRLSLEGRQAIYGDARRADVLTSAGLVGAEYFIVTSSVSDLAAPAIVCARSLDPKVKIIVRTRYLRERDALLALGAHAVTVDEEAVVGGLSMLLMREADASPAPENEPTASA